MCVAFGLSTILQYNDPDPTIWMITYGIATFFTLAYHRNLKIDWKFFAFFSGGTFVWGLAHYLNISGAVMFLDLFEEFTMKDPIVEYGRESGGLFLISLWTATLAYRLNRS